MNIRALALDVSLALGVHGLPLMGTGDWNDGMKFPFGERRRAKALVGWFLHVVLSAFIPLAEARLETKGAVRCAAPPHCRPRLSVRGGTAIGIGERFLHTAGRSAPCQ